MHIPSFSRLAILGTLCSAPLMKLMYSQELATKRNMHILHVPSACLLHAFTYCDAEDIYMLSHVCKDWNTKSPHVWSHYIKKSESYAAFNDTVTALTKLNEMAEWTRHRSLPESPLPPLNATQHQTVQGIFLKHDHFFRSLDTPFGSFDLPALRETVYTPYLFGEFLTYYNISTTLVQLPPPEKTKEYMFVRMRPHEDLVDRYEMTFEQAKPFINSSELIAVSGEEPAYRSVNWVENVTLPTPSYRSKSYSVRVIKMLWQHMERTYPKGHEEQPLCSKKRKR